MSEQREGAQPDDYLDDDAVTDPPEQVKWWQEHKRRGHRVQWAWGGMPICIACGLIFPAEVRAD